MASKIKCILLLLSCLLFSSCGGVSAKNTTDVIENRQTVFVGEGQNSLFNSQPVLIQQPNTDISLTESEQLVVSFLDVGQADCTLITYGDETLLIDAGDANSGDKIVEYMQHQNIDDIDYFVLTHPHADHIGGATTVLNAYEADTLFMPNASHTTKTYQNFLEYISENKYQKTVPNQYDTYTLGDASFEFLSPNVFPYGSNLNNASIIVKLNYKDNSFLFMGDAESPLEDALIQDIGINLKADVIKIGHHGSSSSTTESFMQYVSPEIAVISVGQNNQYGHPAQQVLNLLMTMNTAVYRTDLDGTITLTSDGEQITVKTHDDIQSGDIVQNSGEFSDTDANAWSSDEFSDTDANKWSSDEFSDTDANAWSSDEFSNTDANKWSSDDTESNKEIVVYVTKTGTKYHNSGCRYLSKSKIPISLEDAQTDGYTPCKVCKPAA